MVTKDIEYTQNDLMLDDGSCIAVIGGGPSGSFFSYFLLEMSKRAGIQLSVDIYERRDFGQFGPKGCNMCGGVISESLVQALLIEGIEIPPEVIQRGIDSFKFYTEEEAVSLYAPAREMRIATIYRGSGPLDDTESNRRSFDGYMIQMAEASGAKIIIDRVSDIDWVEGKPRVHTMNGQSKVYELVVGAVGVNTQSLSLFEKLVIGDKPPHTRKTGNMEFNLGSDYIDTNLGNCMHAFLINLPKLDFSAVIPKANHATLCLIGDNINSGFIDDFIGNPAVKKCLSGNFNSSDAVCRCMPMASLGDAVHPYSDRVVLLGDCGMTRLNKDGLGSAYRVAKAAAATVLVRGVSEEEFRAHYWPICKRIRSDNRYGRLLYSVVGIIKKSRLLKRGVMRMARLEQNMSGKDRHLSKVMWDIFTGTASYRDVFMRCLHPGFWSRLAQNIAFSLFESPRSDCKDEKYGPEELMDKSEMGRLYHPGEIIVQRGEERENMYMILSGEAEVLEYQDGKEVGTEILKKGAVFGELAIVHKAPIDVTIRALTDMRILTLDKKVFLRRVHEDPSFVFVMLKRIAERIHELNDEIARLKSIIAQEN